MNRTDLTSRTGFESNGLLCVTDVVLHAADDVSISSLIQINADVSISSLIQINAAVSIHQWISIQSPAVEELISIRGAEHPHHPTGGADD